MKRLLLLALLAGPVLAADDAPSVAGNWLINCYRATLSPLQGPNVCNFWPSCSQFTRAAIAAHGFVPGAVIGADRLVRDNPYAWAYYGSYYLGLSHDRLVDPVEDHLAWAEPPERSGPAPVIAAPAPADTGARMVPGPGPGFADELYASGAFDQAATEYLRARFSDTSPARRRYAGLMAGESYLRAGDFTLARRAFATVDSPADRRRYGIARALFAEERYADARAVLDSIDGGPVATRALTLAGWTMFRQQRFAEGAAVFARAAPGPVEAELAARDGRGMARRSRLLGALFSAVVPGAGQAYAGRAGDGVYSFLAVAGAGAAAAWFAADPGRRDRTRVKVSIFGALAALFYAGGVYGADIAARDYNELQRRSYLDRTEELLRSLPLEPDYRDVLPGPRAAGDSLAPHRQ